MFTAIKKHKPFISGITAFFLFLYIVQPALALPTDPSVQSGDATFEYPDSSTLNATVSDQAIIDWNSFSIAQPETVQFFQPSSSSVVLNRVTGGSISEIFGTLLANGNVFLINPNGIVFGANSRVDVNGLVASTLDISNEDFLNRNYVFTSTSSNPAQIINQGDIRAKDGGYILLLSDSIDNSGFIKADLGKVWLASAEKATVSFDNNNLVSVVLNESTKKKIDSVVDAIKNTGTLQANSGGIYITAEAVNNLFQNAVNTSGILRANTIQQDRAGLIYVKAGDYDSTTGNHIVTGGVVESIDGNITFEGYDGIYQGGDMDVGSGLIYSNMVIGDSTLTGSASGNVDSTETGILTITDYTLTDGNLTADDAATINITGDLILADGADAGSASGALDLQATGDVNISDNITVAQNTIGIFSDKDNSGGGDINHTAGTISATTSGNITIRSGPTSTTGTGNVGLGIVTAAGKITVSAAGGSITSNSSQLTSSGNSIVLSSANGIGTSSAPIEVRHQNAQGRQLTASTSNNGSIYVKRTDGTNLTFDTINAGTGDVSLQTTGGVDIRGASTNSITGATVTLDSSANIGTSTTYLTIAASTKLDATTASNGSIYLERSGGNIPLGTISAHGNGDVNIRTTTSGDLTSNSSSISGDVITLTSAGAIGASGSVINFGANTSITASASGNIFFNRTGGNLTLGVIDASLTGNITVTTTTSGDILSNTASLRGDTISLTSAGNIGASNANMGFGFHNKINADTTSSNGNIFLSIGENDLDLGTINAGTGDVTVSTTTSGNITSNSSSITCNDFTLTSAGGIGTSSAKINTTADTITATSSSGNTYINESSGLTATTISATAGLVDLTVAGNTTITSITASGAGTNSIAVTATSGDLTVATITADDGVTLSANSGSILDDTNASTKVTAGANSVFSAGTIGRLSNPFDVSITGALTVSATGERDGISIDINGTASSDNLTVSNTTPGIVIFNERFLRNKPRFAETDVDSYKHMSSQIADISKAIEAGYVPQQGISLYEKMIDFSNFKELPSLYEFGSASYLVK